MEQTSASPPRTIRIGVISDTHIPDRARALHPQVLPIFRELQVDHIVHAGDVSSQTVLDELTAVAPCTAAKGNRDWFMGEQAPPCRHLSFNNVGVCVIHGHGDWVSYFMDKIPYVLIGYRFERYYRNMKKHIGEAKIVVFGHTHQVENRWADGKLFFNSGSAYDGGYDGSGPTIGVIEIGADGRIESRIIALEKDGS